MAQKIPSSSTQTNRAIEYIKADWQKGRTLKEIAASHGLDPGNLDRAFRQKEGMTQKKYVDGMRARYVKSRISRDDVRGYELATELGFASDFSFYHWVKRMFGISFKALKRQESYKK